VDTLDVGEERFLVKRRHPLEPESVDNVEDGLLLVIGILTEIPVITGISAISTGDLDVMAVSLISYSIYLLEIICVIYQLITTE
jgi:hypothetical protein